MKKLPRITPIYMIIAVVTLMALSACGSDSQSQPQTSPTSAAPGATASVGSADRMETAMAKIAATETAGGSFDPPTAVVANCPPVPQGENMAIKPPCVVGANSMNYVIEAKDFEPGEALLMTVTGPDGAEYSRDKEALRTAQPDGSYLYASSESWMGKTVQSGQYRVTLEGQTSQRKAEGYFYYKPAP